MTLQDFINVNNGKFLDFDGAYGDQCTDLAHFWIKNIGSSQVFAGYAYQYFDKASDADYVKVRNAPANAPAPGDLVLWNPNVKNLTGPAGHIAICVTADAMHLQTFDQNWPTGSPCKIVNHSYTGVLGWLHPRVLDPKPAPEPQPAPVPSPPQEEPQPASPSVPEAPETVTTPSEPSKPAEPSPTPPQPVIATTGPSTPQKQPFPVEVVVVVLAAVVSFILSIFHKKGGEAHELRRRSQPTRRSVRAGRKSKRRRSVSHSGTKRPARKNSR